VSSPVTQEKKRAEATTEEDAARVQHFRSWREPWSCGSAGGIDALLVSRLSRSCAISKWNDDMTLEHSK
jgi:hypothetical protein